MKLAFALFPCLAVLTAASILLPVTVPPSTTKAVPPSTTKAVPPSTTKAVPPSTTKAVPPSTTKAVTTPQTSILPPGRAAALVEALAAVKGCNANVCFAIDGSSDISADEFRLQKEFVLDVISIVSVDHATEQAAVQYGLANSRIQPLTADVAQFNEAVHDAEQVGGGRSLNTGGLSYCIAQLFRRRGEANKVILLGDGIQQLGSRVERRAEWFRRIGGDVSVVAAGKANFTALHKIVGGNDNRIFKVDDFFDVLTLQGIIEELALDVCGENPTLN